MNRKDAFTDYVRTVWAAVRRARAPYCQVDQNNPQGNPDMRPCPRRATRTVAHRANANTWLVLDACDDHARELEDRPNR